MEPLEGATGVAASSRRIFSLLLLLVVTAFTFLDYWSYSALVRSIPTVLAALVRGTGPAPAQYHIGVLFAATCVLRLTRGVISYRHSFAIFDFFLTLAAGLLMRAILVRTPSFRAASPASQWLRLALVLGLALYYLNWSLWYLRPETWASALFVAGSMYVLSAERRPVVASLSLAGLAAVQGFVRADVAILFHVGLLVSVLLGGAGGFLVRRGVLLGSSAAGLAVSTGILWVLMHFVYPHASYGDTAVFQLLRNLAPAQLVPAALFLTPALFTVVRGTAADAAGQGQGRALLLAAALYFVSWAALGRLEEVRIFAPFAFSLMPQTANALARQLELPTA